MAQNQHLFQNIFHNGVPEHLVGIHQALVGIQRNNINLRFHLRLGKQAGWLLQGHGRLPIEPARRQGIKDLLRAVARHHVMPGAPLRDIIHPLRLHARLQEDALGRIGNACGIFADQLLQCLVSLIRYRKTGFIQLHSPHPSFSKLSAPHSLS